MERYINILSLLNSQEISFLNNFIEYYQYQQNDIIDNQLLLQLGILKIKDDDHVKKSLKKLVSDDHTNFLDSYNQSFDLVLTNLGKELVSYIRGY